MPICQSVDLFADFKDNLQISYCKTPLFCMSVSQSLCLYVCLFVITNLCVHFLTQGIIGWDDALISLPGALTRLIWIPRCLPIRVPRISNFGEFGHTRRESGLKGRGEGEDMGESEGFGESVLG